MRHPQGLCAIYGYDNSPVIDDGGKELRELVRRVKSGGAREGDLLRYIELMGGSR